MKFFLDSANIEEIEKALDLGLVDGVTTNPSLLAAESSRWKELASEICSRVDGPVSIEVMETEAEQMILEARKLAELSRNVVVKIPMTLQGVKAVKVLSAENIPTNVTLVFSPLQALLAAKAGAAYVSPFVGRIDDTGQSGMDIVARIINIYENYGFDSRIIVASVRNPAHVLEAAETGADIVTIPYKILLKLADHPMTYQGIQTFEKAWKSARK